VKRALRVASVIIGIPLALFITWFAMVQYQDWRYIHPWERIQRGDTEQHVLQVMGRPDRVLFEHSDKASWESEHKIDWYDAESVKQFRYIPFSITGEEYEVSFDSSG
jgi:hypothetical protein